MQLRFVPSESTASYFEALDGYLKDHGYLVASYSDKHSVFRVNKAEAKGGAGMTQFGCALAELNIEIICANSSQAKGRVERANRTLQDQLVKELRLENVCDLEAGNKFLPGFMERFTERFALKPAATADLHRHLGLQPDRIGDILCHREQRHVGDQLTLAYDRKQLILERSQISEELGGKYVDLYHFADGRLEVRSNGRVLPYRVFDKDQRVSPATVVENKRLGHALSRIKLQQDAKLPPGSRTAARRTGTRNEAERFARRRQRLLWKCAKSPKAAISHIPTARRRAIYNDKNALQIKRRYRFAATTSTIALAESLFNPAKFSTKPALPCCSRRTSEPSVPKASQRFCRTN